jgi:hypothetical protein
VSTLLLALLLAGQPVLRGFQLFARQQPVLPGEPQVQTPMRRLLSRLAPPAF